MTISITSTAFEAGKPIPKKYTGEGEDLSPPLAWSNVPKGTKELALICDDPDAPMGTVGPLGALQDSGRRRRACRKACRGKRP